MLEGTGMELEFAVFDDIDAGTFLATGVAISEDQFERIRASDSVLFGTVGDPRVRSAGYARSVLLRLRNELGLYVNLRPARLAEIGSIRCATPRAGSIAWSSGRTGRSLRRARRHAARRHRTRVGHGH
ncbi:MAG TPA: isocitrate/isopropylmalate family dehydrogenase [Jatrophihabitans sp.]|nr:isocitrate/isopropylmalate family dehydrogenase [Jatrophihabitans sp.]